MDHHPHEAQILGVAEITGGDEMSRRARQRANARPWEQGEAPEDDEPQTGDWSDGCGDGDDEEQEQA